MLEIDSAGAGDYAAAGSRTVGGRLAFPLMTSSRRHLAAADVSDYESDYSAMTSSTMLADDIASYETFTECDFRRNSDTTGNSNCDDIGMVQSRYDGGRSDSVAARNHVIDVDSFGSMLTKSLSMPGPSLSANGFFPDPFPELTESKLAPVSARIYNPDMSPPTRTASDESKCRSLGGSPPNTLAIVRQSSQERVPVNIYIDEHNVNEVSVGSLTTAAEVCNQLIERNNTIHSPQWTLVESIGRYRLERGIEHHEIVLQIHKSWSTDDDCRFFFRKDFTKYELFRNPAQFFPENMVDCKLSAQDDGWLTRSERYKNLLLQNLLANQSIPDVQGYMHIRDKRSWKKHFCLLRGSGLYYSTKGTQKDPQYLVLISTLEDVNIFTSQNTKKVFGAPTNYGICLKAENGPSDSKQFKLLSVEDEQSRICWLTGLRFVKYGAQLRENFRLSLRSVEESQGSKSCSSKQSTMAPLYARSRVAMDFSGERGHVVTDPNEALSIAVEEGNNWRKKCVMRFGSRAAQSCHGSPRTTDEGTTMSQALSAASRQYTVPVAAMMHLLQPWFHGAISRNEAVNLITEQGLVDGVLLLRDSQSLHNTFVLSFAHNHRVKHCTIERYADSDGQIFYSLDKGSDDPRSSWISLSWSTSTT